MNSGPEAEARLARGLELAHAHGINLVDTAEIYGGGRSEEMLGRCLRALGLRDHFVVATKVAGFRTTRDQVVKAARGSARRLGLKPDLLQLHWPPPLWARICDVLRGLEDAVDQGLASYIGVSNFPAGLLDRALGCLRRHELVSNQVQYSLAYRAPEARLKPLMESRGLTLIAWSPLAKGALAGLREPRTPAQRRDPVFRAAASDSELQAALEAVASRHGTSKAVVALAWLVSRGALPIPGFRDPGRVVEYARAAELELGPDELELLDRVSRKYVGRGDYDALAGLRLVPAWLQRLLLGAKGGI